MDKKAHSHIFLYMREKLRRESYAVYMVRPDHLEPKSLKWNENRHLNIISITHFIRIATHHSNSRAGKTSLRANYILRSLTYTHIYIY